MARELRFEGLNSPHAISENFEMAIKFDLEKGPISNKETYQRTLQSQEPEINSKYLKRDTVK